MKKAAILLLCTLTLAPLSAYSEDMPMSQAAWGDQGDGTFKNPFLYADYNNLDVTMMTKTLDPVGNNMKFILTALCGVLLSTAYLYAADATPPPFTPNAAHTNVTPYALAQAETAPFGTDPMRLVRGEGAWQNAGRDPAVRDRVSIARTSVNEAYPSWFVLVWPEPIPLSALRLRTNVDRFRVYLLSGDHDNPALAPDDRWDRVWTDPATRAGGAQNELVHEFVLPDGARARALKVQLLEVQPRNSQERKAVRHHREHRIPAEGRRPVRVRRHEAHARGRRSRQP